MAKAHWARRTVWARLTGKIHVLHGFLGKSAVPMKRRAVVVQLDFVPRNIYVDCAMVE